MVKQAYILFMILLLSAGMLPLNVMGATESGEVVFVSGEVWKLGSPDKARVARGSSVEEGNVYRTGPDGYLYLKMRDGGIFILRPNSEAQLRSYRYDASNPAENQIKFELVTGVARTISGKASKAAPQRFRFNTPVAAIGVRGTDFSVFTTTEVTRVTVAEGAVVFSPLVNGCRAEDFGPCSGESAQVLMAGRAEVMEARRGESRIVREPLKTGDTPDRVIPSAPQEPLQGTISRKEKDIIDVASSPASPEQPPLGSTTPPPAPTLPATPELRQIYWGRWQELANLPANTTLSDLSAKGKYFVDWPIWGMYQLDSQTSITVPKSGTVSFTLQDSESHILRRTADGATLAAQASVSNPALSMDFGNRTFETRLTVSDDQISTNIRSKGNIDNNGRFLWDLPGSNASVQGVLAGQNASQAGYVFSQQINKNTWATGSTYWTR